MSNRSFDYNQKPEAQVLSVNNFELRTKVSSTETVLCLDSKPNRKSISTARTLSQNRATAQS